MKPFKMEVTVPEHVRARRTIKVDRWFTICGGGWDGATVYVEPLAVGADIVLRTTHNEVVRWMFATTGAARRALARWNGEDAPFNIDELELVETEQ